MSQDRSQRPRNVLPDFIIPICAAAFTIYYWTTITEVPWTSQASAVLVGSLLLVAIGALVVRTTLRLRAGTETLSFDFGRTNLLLAVRRLALLSLAIGYVWLLEPLGFTATTSVFLFLAIILLSSRRTGSAHYSFRLAALSPDTCCSSSPSRLVFRSAGSKIRCGQCFDSLVGLGA